MGVLVQPRSPPFMGCVVGSPARAVALRRPRVLVLDLASWAGSATLVFPDGQIRAAAS